MGPQGYANADAKFKGENGGVGGVKCLSHNRESITSSISIHTIRDSECIGNLQVLTFSLLLYICF